MDLALAASVRENLKKEGTNIDSWQFQVLSYECRSAKEKLLQKEKMESCPVVIPGRGSKLIGGSIKTELKRSDLEKILLEGFFPLISPSEHPKANIYRLVRWASLSQTCNTKHLAKFLSAHVKSLKINRIRKEKQTFATRRQFV